MSPILCPVSFWVCAGNIRNSLLASQGVTMVVTVCAIEFFMISPQYKTVNIANFVLSATLKGNPLKPADL